MWRDATSTTGLFSLMIPRPPRSTLFPYTPLFRSSIQVTDTPTNLTITNVSGSGCAALPCTIASLASGANTTINVTATITASGAFDNTATATPAEADTNLANNTSTTGNTGPAAGTRL